MHAYIVTYRYALINDLTAWFHHPSPKAAGNVAKNVGHSPASPVTLIQSHHVVFNKLQ